MATVVATDIFTQSTNKLLANRYKIEKTLGSGTCGTAFLTVDVKSNKKKRKVIKKICIGNLALGDTVTAANEGKILKELKHPHIITYFDSFIQHEFYCIVTEFCDEGDLDSKIMKNKARGCWLEEAQIIMWVAQVLLALDYIHSRSILHRDLKTKNIFLKQNQVKLGDFGISRILATPAELAETFVGTPYYMSPEVLNHHGYNTKSDIWSVGCILYDLACFEHPFKGSSIVSIIDNILQATHPTWPSRYSKQLGKFFLRLTERDQKRRPTAREALETPFMQALQLTSDTMVQDEVKVAQSGQHIFNTIKQKTRLDELKLQTDLRSLPPRDRVRLRRMMKADQEAMRNSKVVAAQYKETNDRYAAIKQSMSPFHSSLVFGEGSKQKKKKELSRACLACEFRELPDTAQSAESYYSQFEDFEDEEDEEEEDGRDGDKGEIESNKLKKENTTVAAPKATHNNNMDSVKADRSVGSNGVARGTHDRREDEKGEDQYEIAEEIEGSVSDTSTIEDSSNNSSGSTSSRGNSDSTGSESNLIKSFHVALESAENTVNNDASMAGGGQVD